MQEKLPYKHKIIIDTFKKGKVDFIALSDKSGLINEKGNLQLWINPQSKNKVRLYKALNNLGYNTGPLEGKAFKQHIMTNSIDLDLNPKLSMHARLSYDYDFNTIKELGEIRSLGIEGKNKNNIGLEVLSIDRTEISRAKVSDRDIAKKHNQKSSIKDLFKGISKGKSR